MDDKVSGRPVPTCASRAGCRNVMDLNRQIDLEMADDGTEGRSHEIVVVVDEPLRPLFIGHIG